MAITIADIARKVGVHQSTVSTVLNKSRSTIRISDKTRRKIFDAAQELNYRPSFSARALAKGRTFSLGMLCGDIQSPHFSEMADVVLRQTEDRGYHLVVSVTGWVATQNNLDCLETLIGRGVDGILCWGSGLRPDTPLYEQILREQYPIVTVEECVPGLSSVTCDWEAGIRQAVAYLAGKGHKEILFAGADESDPEKYDKRIAFLSACEACHVVPRENPIHHRGRLPAAEAYGRELAKMSHRPRALMVYSDYMAIGVARGLQASGVRIPEDIALVGMDGTHIGKYWHPSLTSISQDRQKIAAAAVDMLIRRIDDRDLPPETVCIPMELALGESAG